MLWLTINQVHNGHSLVDSRKYTPFLSLSEWTNYLPRGMQYSCRWKLRLRLFPALPQKAAVIAGNTLPKVDETMTHSLLFFYSVFFFFLSSISKKQRCFMLTALCCVGLDSFPLSAGNMTTFTTTPPEPCVHGPFIVKRRLNTVSGMASPSCGELCILNSAWVYSTENSTLED